MPSDAELVQHGEAALTAGALARAMGRLNEALQAFQAGGGTFSSLDERYPGRYSVERAIALARQGEVIADLGRLGDAGQRVEEALSIFAGLDAATGRLARAQEADVLRVLGKLQYYRNEPESAKATLLRALKLFDEPSPPSDRVSRADRARVSNVLGIVFVRLGDLESARREMQASLETIEALVEQASVPDAVLLIDHARLLMNIGTVEWEAGSAAAARTYLRRALERFEILDRRSILPLGGDHARCLMNCASALLDSGARVAALARASQAVQAFADLVDKGQLHWRSSLARARTNFGNTLYRFGAMTMAVQYHRQALADFEMLRAQDQPQWEFDLARTVVNLGHTLRDIGAHRGGQHFYERALEIFERGVANGHHEQAHDQANARLSLGKALLQSEQPAQAGMLCAAALTTLHRLVEQGQLQHSVKWATALRQLVAALIAGWPVQAAGASRQQASATLTHAFQQPPMRALGFGTQKLTELIRGVDVLEDTDTATLPTDLESMVAGFRELMLRWLADLFGESDPDWLARHQDALAAVTERLHALVAAQGNAAWGLADWFIHTRGLRAQRNAIASGADARVQALAAALDELRRIEDEMMSRRSASGAQSGPLQARWRHLHNESMHQRAALVVAGLLPDRLQLDAFSVGAKLEPRQGLLMLARLSPSQIQVIALYVPAVGGIGAMHAVARMAGTTEPVDCRMLNRRLRRLCIDSARGRALRRGPTTEALLSAEETAGQPGDEAAILSAYRDLAQTALEPTLLRLAALGIDAAALVPSADLHLLPWSDAVASWLPREMALSVYPSCAAWALQHPRSAARATAPAEWAVIPYAALASPSPLPWVEVEHRLSLELWHDPPGGIRSLAGEPPQAEGVNALLGIGHGASGGAALAGLQIGPGRLLTAHDLPAIRTCRRVMLSCCVLGQIDEVHHEALGFIATSFGYQTHWSAGWLIEVADAEAALFALAFQFALRRHALGTQWNEVFHSVRSGIAGGQWPPGFGAWLADRLPPLLRLIVRDEPCWVLLAQRYEMFERQGLFSEPPVTLRDLMPWVVSLGC